MRTYSFTSKDEKKGPTEQEEDIHGPDVLVEEEEAENIPGPDVLEEEEVIAAPEVLEEEEIPMEPANKTRRCPKGTRFDKKTGLCNKTKKIENDKTNKNIEMIVRKSREKEKGKKTKIKARPRPKAMQR